MMKRVLSVVFAAVLLIGLLAVIPIGANATSGMVTSETCVNLIKRMEGFVAIPAWDYGQWTVGFGSRCPDEDLARYQKEGIPMDEADALMREHLDVFESSVNAFAERNGLTLSQSQFDALVCMTYNLGTALLYNENHRVNKALLNGFTGNDLIYAFSVHCTAGGEFLPGLIRRRLVEANMYINGEYGAYAPENYCYVLYDANGGTRDVTAQGYDCNLPAEPLSVPTYTGYTFIGWYTEATGGTKVTTLDETTDGMTLYAHWEQSKTEADNSTLPDGKLEVTVTAEAVNVRNGPGLDYAISGGVFRDEKITIIGIDTVDGKRWGRFEAGWIPLQYTNYGELTGDYGDSDEDNQQKDVIEVPVRATVLSTSGVTVYNGPHTTYPKLGTLSEGTEIEITEVFTLFDTQWGKCEDGWVQLNLKLQLHDDQRLAHPFVVTVNYTYLNVRSGPGTQYSRTSTLQNGATVEIVAIEYVGTAPWGRCNAGWIALNYTDFDASRLEEYRNHSYGDWHESVAATCVIEGEERRDCQYCDAYETQSVPVTAHSYGDWYESVAATCVTEGEERRDCTGCTAYETRQTELGDHSYGDWYESAAATCVTAGQERHDCQYCDSYETRETEVSGHSYGDWYESTAATCATPGEERRDCTVCDAFETREIAKVEHNYDAWVIYLEATCAAVGEERRTCLVCGTYESREIPVEEHSFGQWYETVIPTVDTPGEERRDCVNCGYFETRELEPTTHVYDVWYVVIAATCTEDGEERRNCLHCEEFQTRVVPATGHSFAQGYVTEEPTCTTEGQERSDCQNCGEYQTNVIPALGHDYSEWIVLTEPSCTAGGEQCRMCQTCTYLQVENIEALPHNYGAWEIVTPADCGNDGEQFRTCPDCGQTEQEVIPASGHAFGQWYVVTEAVCGQDGEQRRDCSVCGAFESQLVAATDHSFTAWYVYQAASCGVAGEERRDCENCDHYESRTIAALEHSYGEWYVYREAVCGVDGEARRDCANCGGYETLTVYAPQHTFGDWYVFKLSTCTAAGEERRDCSVCGGYESRAIAANGHSFGDWYVTVEPTTSAEGQERRDCGNCGSYETRSIDKLLEKVTKVYGTVTAFYVNLRAGVGTNYAKMGTMFFGERVEILEQVTASSGLVWGRIGENTWVRLTNYLKVETVEEEQAQVTTKLYATIICDLLNIRSGASTTFNSVGFLLKGDVVEILEQVNTDSKVWGRIDKGWICLTENATLKTQTTTVGGPADYDPVIMATVTYDGLNIRSEAGVEYDKMGVLSKGERVEILQFKLVYNTYVWGLIEQGWIRLDGFVTLEVTENGTAAGHTYGSWYTTKEPTCVAEGSERRDCTHCDEFETRVIAALDHSYGQWTVIQEADCFTPLEEARMCSICNYVELRTSAAAGHSYGDWAVATMPTCTQAGVEERICANCGQKETQAIAAVGHSYGQWYETKAPTATESGEERRDCANCDAYETRKIEPLGGVVTRVYGYVTGNSYVNIRAGIGAGNELLGTLQYGDRVEILEQGKDAYGRAWGRISENGWICLPGYVTLQTVEENADGTGISKTVTKTYGTVTTKVNIRGGAGVGYDLLGVLYVGTTVEVLEIQTGASGILWGRISENAWVRLSGYVKTETATETEISNEKPFSMKVYVSRAYLYAEASTSSTSTGYLIFAVRVNILELKMVNGQMWARTLHGWLLTENLVS